MKNQHVDAIMWFRRDLRLDDNHALFRALSDHQNALSLFIFDERILQTLPRDDARVTFIWDALADIRIQLQAVGSDLLVCHGKVEDVFADVSATYGSCVVYANEDYEPYARKRDQSIKRLVEQSGGTFRSYKDHVLQAPGEVLKDDGTPYSVYTPYSKKALALAQEGAVYGEYEITDVMMENFVSVEKLFDTISLQDLGFERHEQVHGMQDITQQFLDGYTVLRDIPSETNGTSHAGVHLRFGTVSVRSLARESLQSADNTFLKELLWRDFFQCILYYYPQTPTIAFKVKYDTVPWRSDVAADEDFQAWCSGLTGYPLVDAGMRELNATGSMHNRVRMLTASFLCKHLLIDWRRGERYFAQKLMDYELASNVGNWQWAMGGGCDAAPYFRIFNPYTQQEKFDKDLLYVKKWIPEYGTDAYPEPIIEHKYARERALTTYKSALATTS